MDQALQVKKLNHNQNRFTMPLQDKSMLLNTKAKKKSSWKKHIIKLETYIQKLNNNQRSYFKNYKNITIQKSHKEVKSINKLAKV